MLLLINHRYPRLGAVLSVLSSVVFIVVGVAGHNKLMIAVSAAWLVLPVVKTVAKRRGAFRARS